MPTTPTPHIKILVIESDAAVTQQIHDALGAPGTESFAIECVARLEDGLERLSRKGIDAVLLALALPDSQGIATFDKVFAVAPDLPILILGGNVPEALAKEAVGRGAQDYLLPDHVDSYSLSRAVRNAIERKSVEDALFAERERAVVTLNSIGDAVLCTDISGCVTYLNLVAESMTGWPRAEAIGKPLAEVFHIIDAATRAPAEDPVKLAIDLNKTVSLTLNCVLVRRDGSEFSIEDSSAPIHDRNGSVIGAVVVFHDISAARAISNKMLYLAQHDVVTDLANRTLVNDRITQSISLARRQKKPIAVLFLDLDHFKNINDSLGHAIGDQLLLSVSKRLVASVRHSDTVSRQGGDEFVILLSEIAHAKDAATSAAKILSSLNEPHIVAGHELHIDGSIGISVFPGDGEDVETLIKNADTAMYHAKELGRNNFQFFKTEMNLAAVKRQSLEARLRRAVEREELVLHYQPKVKLKSGQITGTEALLRWRQPDGTLLPPAQFIPVAEDSGLIVPIGHWVMQEACRQARAWQDFGLRALPIAVNVSAVEFRHPGFVSRVRNILSETGLDPHLLELELTEGVLMRDVESTAVVLRELKAIGVRLAVDDFGTGYSSLSYLRRFPMDVLKIDQSFIHDLTASPDESIMVGAIINMGKSLKHVVVAEGIETAVQRAHLEAQSCAEGQGFLFSHPLAAAQFANLLKYGLPEMVVN
ncbi:MAG TPA: EAL domain-containing protein [Candidatus Acidoferrum sp.]